MYGAYSSSVDTTESIDFSELETGSDEFGSYSVGHNLSTNGRTLKKKQASIGTLFFAYGLTDNWTIGTSPFVYQTFGMLNLMSRVGFRLSKNHRLSFDYAYFKTIRGREVTYEDECYFDETNQVETCYGPQTYLYGFWMEAVNFKATYSYQAAKYYRFNTTASYFYYFDDREPFSFRMDPANGDPYTINLTTLHELRLYDQLFFNFEIGVWGFNYQYPYLHTGATLNFQLENWLIGLGGSTTYSPGFPVSSTKWFRGGYDSRYSVHPEFEIQYFF